MSGLSRATVARIRQNESEVVDNLHQPVAQIIESTRPTRYAVPLEVSGDALARARRNVRLEVTA